MISTGLLTKVAVVEGIVFVTVLVILFAHAFVLRITERRSAPQIEAGRALLRGAIGGRISDASVDRLAQIPKRVQIDLFEELAPSLSGQDRLQLMVLARAVGLIAMAEGLCQKRSWGLRLRGVRLLTLLGGGDDVVPPLLADRVTEVRAQAAEWAAGHPHPATIERLLVMLGDEKSLCRFTVQDSLLRLGGVTAPHLKLYLESPGTPDLVPALHVAARLRDPRFISVATKCASHPDPAVRGAAVEVLGSIGGEGATSILTRLLGDQVDIVRAAAASALGNLGHWPAAAAIARLLEDLSFDVRREAGKALKKLGAPGRLLLKRARSSGKGFASDMARHMLDMPGAAGTH